MSTPKTYCPSQDKTDFIEEITGETILARRLQKLLEDFNESVHDLPKSKVLIDSMLHHGEKAQQETINFAWDFFLAGVLTILDKKSHFNTSEYPKSSKFNDRRDLN